VLVLVSLVIPGVVDLVIVAIVPPLLYPVEAVGLALLAIEAYRIHGVMAHVAVGIGWAVAGLTEAVRPRR
jgi:hypothetical protein